MERPLMGLQAVGVLVVQGEQGPPVLNRKADVPRHHLRAEAGVVALDEGAAIAVLIDDG